MIEGVYLFLDGGFAGIVRGFFEQLLVIAARGGSEILCQEFIGEREPEPDALFGRRGELQRGFVGGNGHVVPALKLIKTGEFFGEKRLVTLLKRKRISVDRLPHMVLDQVLAFSGGGLQDDVAILALSLTGVGEGAARSGPDLAQQTMPT